MNEYSLAKVQLNEKGYKNNHLLQKPISQSQYISPYGFGNKTTPVAQTHIDRIEVVVNNNEKLDERKMAEMIGEEVGKKIPEYTYSLIRPFQFS